MNRRDFLRRAAIVATGAVAADQLDLLERLTWRRRHFASVDLATSDAIFSIAQPTYAAWAANAVETINHRLSQDVIRQMLGQIWRTPQLERAVYTVAMDRPDLIKLVTGRG